MPLTFPKRNISDAENRLRLLFCVDALGMLTREQLWPFVARLDLMDYMPMCLYVDELIRDGSLSTGVHAAEGSLCLTDEGQSTLRLFLNRMPQNDRDRIFSAAPAYAATLREKRQIRAAHELAPSGWSQVACTIREGDLPTLFLRVKTRRRAVASGAMKRFRLCAPGLLTMLFSLPPSQSGPVFAPEEASDLEKAMGSVAPETPFICDFSRHEYAGVICLQDEHTAFQLALLLPSREAATHWVNAALSQPALLGQRIQAMLMGKDAME